MLGNLSVSKGGSLAMTNTVVGGNADCIGCSGATMANSTVLGNFSQIADRRAAPRSRATSSRGTSAS